MLSGRNAALLTFPAALVATGALVGSLMSEQYQLAYVYSVTDPQTPAIYRFTALWGSQKGSLLLWSLIDERFHFRRDRPQLAKRAAADALRNRLYDGDVGVSFSDLSLLVENPFERWWILPDAPAG